MQDLGRVKRTCMGRVKKSGSGRGQFDRGLGGCKSLGGYKSLDVERAGSCNVAEAWVRVLQGT